MKPYDSMAAMWPWLWPALAFVLGVLAALAVRGLLLGAIERWARPGGALVAVADAIRRPALVWSLVVGLYAALDTAELPARLRHPLGVVLQSAIILSVTVTAAGVLGRLIARTGERHTLGAAVTGWGQAVARGTVLIVGALVLLTVLGIQITPILTALGVGGLAVALALQDTLSNLFAGLHLLADKPIQVGHYVRLAEGVEGFVTDIGWRSTRLRTLVNTVVVVPNKKVSESIITNYDLPSAFTGVSVKIVVDYGADADRVERALLEEAQRATREVRGLQTEAAPGVTLSFGDAGLEFTVAAQVAAYSDQGPVLHELRKRILRRLHAERIPLAVQVRTVELRQPGAFPDEGEQAQPADHRER
jgi:small-conductance mechanosensitive channel